jgi:SAM-dependent methyltransferase
MVSPLPNNPQAQLADLRSCVEAHYRSCGRFARGYVHWKLRLDPILPAMLALAQRERFGSVVDLGCGRGQLGVALLEEGLVERLTGLDWDERLLAEARAATGARGTFLQADLRTAAVPEADTALLIDILYLMPAEAQLGLLRRAAAAARERLIVRVFDPARGWRSMVGWLSEGGIWLAGLYRRSQVRPLPLATVRATLEEAGFTTTAEPCWGIMPLPNILVVAKRR